MKTHIRLLPLIGLLATLSLMTKTAWCADLVVVREPEAACQKLREQAGTDFKIETAEIAGAKDSLPAHCLFRATLNPRTTTDGQPFGIGFELRLPVQWNGRFAFQGGGGLDGVLNPALGDVYGSISPSALARGFAVVSSDGGHRGQSMLDAHFGLDQQARIDYAFNGIDKVTLKAKALIAAFYGQAAQRSYFIGCSNGGRQGMLMAQRFPLYFDGVVAGAPVFNLSRIVANQIWNVQVVSRIAPRDAAGQPVLSRAFTDEQLKRISSALLEACDARDGLADGLINDWRTCPFDPAALTCKGRKDATCLSREQVTALHDIFGGARNARGESLYGRYPYDTGIAQPVWRQMHLGTSATAQSNASDVVLGVETLRYYMLTPPDPRFDPLKFDFDRDLARTRTMQGFTDADATYLRTFAQRGKLILYHGVSDQGMAAGALTQWYEQAGRDTGGRTQDWARLFLIPGMTHCGGGYSTDQFDMLTAIQSWVEEGHAPDRIVATGSKVNGAKRPLCPYPTIARYQGGDPASEQSFACRE
jgi:feruloyl esterase